MDFGGIITLSVVCFVVGMMIGVYVDYIIASNEFQKELFRTIQKCDNRYYQDIAMLKKEIYRLKHGDENETLE